MRHGCQNLARQLFGEKHGPASGMFHALGLATWAEFPLSAIEGDEVFGVAFRATNAGEAPLKASAGKELLH